MQQQQQQQQEQQPPLQQTQQPEVLYGIPLNGIDEETRKLVRQVMQIATVILTVYFLNLIISWLTASISFFEMLIGIFIAGLVPMCGYYGAKDRNMTLLNWFTVSNGCCACWQIITLLGSFVALANHEKYCEECVKQASRGMANATCGEIYTADTNCNVTGAYIWVTVSCLLMCGLYTYAAQLSQKLSARPVFMQHVPGNNPVNTVVMHQQPGTVVQARVVSVGSNPPQVIYAPNSGPTVVSGQPTVVSGQQAVYQYNTSQPQMVVSQPRAGPSAIYQAHATIPNQQVVTQQISSANQQKV